MNMHRNIMVFFTLSLYTYNIMYTLVQHFMPQVLCIYVLPRYMQQFEHCLSLSWKIHGWCQWMSHSVTLLILDSAVCVLVSCSCYIYTPPAPTHHRHIVYTPHAHIFFKLPHLLQQSKMHMLCIHVSERNWMFLHVVFILKCTQCSLCRLTDSNHIVN